MKQYIFTLKEDVCSAHNKTVAQQNELIKVLSEYGSLEDYDTHISNLKKKYQEVVDNLTNQYNAIVEKNLTESEMNIVKAYRTNSANDKKSLEDENIVLRKTLEDEKNNAKLRIDKIRAVCGEEE